MSVDVILLPAVIPARLANEDIDRMRRFEGRATDDQVRFEYSVMPSGALAVWRLSGPGLSPEIETVFGPAAWEEVLGDPLRPMS